MTGRTWTVSVNDEEADLVAEEEDDDGLGWFISLTVDWCILLALNVDDDCEDGDDEEEEEEEAALAPSAVHVYFPSSAARSTSVTVNVPFG